MIMKKIKIQSMALVTTLVIASGSYNFSHAQKYEQAREVKYIQLPVNASYAKADVYILKEQDKGNKMIGSAFGKLTDKPDNSQIKESFDLWAGNVLKNKEEKYATWTFFEGDYNKATNDRAVKVLITYLPDDMARPMSKPMQNNDQEYVFSYRVTAGMKVYDQANNLLLEKDFGAISGIAASKDWPESAKGAKGMFKVTTTGEDESSVTHPYEKACVEGALEHCQRVVYGMYGVKEFTVPMSIMWGKSRKETKDYAEDFKKMLDKKEGTMMSAGDQTKLKKFVAFWEEVLPKMEQEEKWGIHLNLANAYSWLVNPNKSREHIAKVAELNNDVFDKVAHKSGNFGGKDLKMVEAYNSLQPFAAYYAAGLQANADYMLVPAAKEKLPYYAAGVSILRSMILTKTLGMPAPMPLYPIVQKAGVRKAEGAIKAKGTTLAEVAWDYSHDQLEAVNVKGENKYDKLKVEFLKPDNSDHHPSHMNRYYESFDGYEGQIRADIFRKSPEIFEFTIFDLKSSEAFPIFASDEYHTTHVTKGGSMKVVLENGFYKELSINYNDFEAVMNKDKEYKAQIRSDDGSETYKVVSTDKSGLPSKIEATMVIKDAYLDVHAHIKYKFGEETYKESSRQRSANSEAYPTVKELFMNMAEANGATVEEASDGKHFTFKMTKNYDVKVTANSKDMWTKITMGDCEISREIK